jgi:alpha-pyrone synthase
MTEVYINSIGLAVPEHKVSQESYLEKYLNSQHIGSEESRLLKTICFKSGIKERYSVIDDFSNETGRSELIGDGDAPGIAKRMEIFESKAPKLIIEAVSKCFEDCNKGIENQITHVITFSCTGMSAPGIDTVIIEAFNLPDSAERTCINFMGCYAAIVALKNAYHIVRSDPRSKVLVAGVEICSLHHNFSFEAEQMVANAIFSDGAAAVVVSSQKDLSPKTGFKISAFHALFSPTGKREMTWKIGEKAFEIFLSSYVPKLLNKELSDITQKLLDKTGLLKQDIHYYAIHPGGTAILKACEKALEISEQDLIHSYTVLKKFGNMSSVTVLFVLQSLSEQIKEGDKNKNVLSFAFGPGLTMESMLLKIN